MLANEQQSSIVYHQVSVSESAMDWDGLENVFFFWVRRLSWCKFPPQLISPDHELLNNLLLIKRIRRTNQLSKLLINYDTNRKFSGGQIHTLGTNRRALPEKWDLCEFCKTRGLDSKHDHQLSIFQTLGRPITYLRQQIHDQSFPLLVHLDI